jgi:hypothetical protein
MGYRWEVGMTDMLIRDVPDDVIAAVDTPPPRRRHKAARHGPAMTAKCCDWMGRWQPGFIPSALDGSPVEDMA